MNSFPIKIPKFLLPNSSVDLCKWATIACDQHTQDRQFWSSLQQLVGSSPSTLNLMLPEIYLNDLGHKGEALKARARQIHANMQSVLQCNLLNEHEGIVSIKRSVANGKTRSGLVISVDLENYSFNGENVAIRASEDTVLERLPPRVTMRDGAALDMPHIMLLYDDPYFTVEKVAAVASTPLYSFNLNMGGGHIQGSLISDGNSILTAFKNLLNISKAKYGSPFLFAVGDGNHSLAAAKQVYDRVKSRGGTYRYILCEAVNLHDPALEFEPIHRLVFAKNPQEFLQQLNKNIPTDPIAVVAYVDDFAKKQGLDVDYIHGIEHLNNLAKQKNAAKVLLKSIDKSGFFPYIAKHGALPKKTFSMGEAEDKRYYLEVAKLQK